MSTTSAVRKHLLTKHIISIKKSVAIDGNYDAGCTDDEGCVMKSIPIITKKSIRSIWANTNEYFVIYYKNIKEKVFKYIEEHFKAMIQLLFMEQGSPINGW